ncbi:MAG: hypothetical protein HQM10_01765 [Candidatus Riflebacteria bacterium]|nr:hypothetical protein [Candidatus Riflebacteria bacterium]
MEGLDFCPQIENFFVVLGKEKKRKDKKRKDKKRKEKKRKEKKRQEKILSADYADFQESRFMIC